MAYWGYHSMYDCSDCNSEAIRDYNTIYRFTKELVKRIDMVAYGEPQIVHFGSDDKAGFSMVQLIETSNICAHFVNEYNHIYLDVFSCKRYDTTVVEDLLYEYFDAGSIRKSFLTRQA